MLKVDFHIEKPDSVPLSYVVIVARHNGKWVLVRHRKRDTYEIPGGHIETGEDYLAAAKRELYEETGAVDFTLDFITIYSVTTGKKADGGYLFYADIKDLSELPDSEIAEVLLFDVLPENLTYPLIQPHLHKRVLEWMTSRGLEFKTTPANDEKTGWERDNRIHFDEIVVNYDKVRWDYPEDLFRDIIDYSGADNKKALEIGAGTGKATGPFLNAGYEVTAVELGENMAAFIGEKFKGFEKFKVIVSTFEEATLEENSFDVAYAASAFHWVDAEIGCPKVMRLLKSGGTFALFRNNAVPVEDELYDDVQEVYNKYYYSFYRPNQRPVPISKMVYQDFLSPSEIYRGFRFESLEKYGFQDVTMKLYNVSRSYSADDYISLLDTYSDHRALPDENRMALYSGIKKAILMHGGHQNMNFIFQLYMGRKA